MIATLAGQLLKSPATVQIGRRAAAAVGITQAAYPVPAHRKTALLLHLLRAADMPSVLVFTRTKHGAKKLARAVAADGFTVAELHGNRTPAQRTQAMAGFRRGDVQVMVATNVAARGLDVDRITHVISTDVPDVPEDYVHRIGRTGRAGAAGDAFVMVSPDEEESLARIERQAGRRLPRVTLPEFDYRAAAPGPEVRPARRPGPPAKAGRPPAKGRAKSSAAGMSARRGGPPPGAGPKAARGGGRAGR